MSRIPTPADIRARFPGHDYVAFHSKRYAVLLEMLDRAGVAQATRILDIGNSPFTDLLADLVSCPIDNLGLDGDFDTEYGHSYYFDLNATIWPEKWKADLPSYDLIVFAEVIEHLHTAPRTVLSYLKTLLSERGVIAIQTPNAVVLHNRIQMLLGQNPFEPIRETVHDPGHSREYTRAELCEIAELAGLEVIHWSAHNYFDYRFFEGSNGVSKLGVLLNAVYETVPGSLKPGLTLLVRAKRER